MEGDKEKPLREKKSIREDKTWYWVEQLAMNEDCGWHMLLLGA